MWEHHARWQCQLRTYLREYASGKAAACCHLLSFTCAFMQHLLQLLRECWEGWCGNWEGFSRGNPLSSVQQLAEAH